MDRSELELLTRDELIAKAEAVRVSRATLLTRSELVDEILRKQMSGKSNEAIAIARGFFGIARDLITRVVERGLHLPDAAERLRSVSSPPKPQPVSAAIPTVTLAEIYASQGYYTRAVETLHHVLADAPDNLDARAYLERLGGHVVDQPVIAPEPLYADDLDGDREAPNGGPFLNDAPLPARYEVDECVAMPVDPSTLFVYWEVRDQTIDAFRGSDDAQVFLHVTSITPTWLGPNTEHNRIAVNARVGEYVLRDITPDAVVRVGIFLDVKAPDGSTRSIAVAQSPLLALAPAEVAEVLPRAAEATSGENAATYRLVEPNVTRTIVPESALYETLRKAVAAFGNAAFGSSERHVTT
jgi:Domain of unknown function (DUF4912)